MYFDDVIKCALIRMMDINEVCHLINYCIWLGQKKEQGVEHYPMMLSGLRRC